MRLTEMALRSIFERLTLTAASIWCCTIALLQKGTWRQTGSRSGHRGEEHVTTGGSPGAWGP
jgi:hypothetical protein